MKKDILVTGKRGFIGKRIAGGKSFKGRITRHGLFEQSKDIKCIIHLAAKSNKRICASDPKKCIESNLIALCDVLEVSLKKKISVLFISTFQIRERNIYGLSKLMGEELCRLYKSKGLNVNILRLPIVYGPNDKSDKIVTRIINALKSGGKIKIKTKKKFYFAYVDDVAAIIENGVDMLLDYPRMKYSLTELTDGIKKCLKGENND